MHKIIFFLLTLTAIPLFAISDLSKSEMFVMSLEEWSEQGLNDSLIETCLSQYHETAPFHQTLEEYRANPEEYFTRRLSALEGLLHALDASSPHPILLKIKQQAINKKWYIQALPDIKSPQINKPEVWQTAKALIPLLEACWPEALDPLHRRSKGDTTSGYRWMASDIPNYFIYLDTLESNQLFNTYSLDDQVHYESDPQQRNQNKLSFKNGLAYHGDNFLDTTHFHTKRQGLGIADYVLGPDGNFYIQNATDNTLSHSTLLAGGHVLGAGELHACEGRISFINNRSGHYCPQAESLRLTAALLKEKLGPLSDLKKIAYKPSDKTYEIHFDADDFLKNGIKALPLTSTKGSPLHYAIQNDLKEWAVLTEAPQYVNFWHQGSFPLHIAAKEGDLFWIKQLLQARASPYVTNMQGMTPLEVAASAGEMDAIRLLCIETKDEDIQKNAVLYAAKSGSVNAIKLFERRHFSLNQTDKAGNTIFHYAAMAPTSEMLQYLYKNKALTELAAKPNRLKRMPLYYAAAYGCAASMHLLINQGSDPLAVDDTGNTLLHAATQEGNTQAVNFIFKHGPHQLINQANINGTLPLHYATATLPLDQYKILCTKTNDLNSQNAMGESPLFYAFRSTGQEALVNLCYLLENGADASISNRQGLTALHKGTQQNKRLPHILILLTYYDGLNDVSGDGDLPLHSALAGIYKPIQLYLIKHATPQQLLHRNHKGLCPLDIAIERGEPEIMPLLQSRYEELSPSL